MTQFRLWLKFWLPVGLWMLVIFMASTGAMSSDNTSRIIGPVLRWFFPDITAETISTVQWFVRKCAHGTEYFVLALLVWRARAKPLTGIKLAWRWDHAVFTVLFCLAYAISDELHQSFIPTRQGDWVDVLIDTCGAVAALVFIGLTHRLERPSPAKMPGARKC